MGTFFGLALVILRAAYHHLVAVVHKVADAVLKREQTGTALDERDAVYGKRRLQRRHLEEFVEHHIGVGLALHVDNDAHTVAVALVVDVGDAVNLLFVHQRGNALDEFGLVHAVGYLSHHDGIVLGAAFYLGAGAHHYAAAACFVSALHALHAHDVAARREVGGLDILHEFLNADVGVVDVGHAAVNHFTQVVRGHVGSHTNGNTAGTVHQEVGNKRGHHLGLVEGVVEVAVHVYGFLVQVLHHGLAHLRESCLGVTHGSGGVAVHRTEVSLSLYQGIAHIPVLRHTHQGAVHRTVAVRVVLTEHVTHDTCALTCRFVVRNAESHHAVQDAAVHGLEAVAHIGQGAGHNYRHGVVNIRGLHFFLYIDLNNSVCVYH